MVSRDATWFTALILALALGAPPAGAQKYGGVLRGLLREPPADLSLHESSATDNVFAASALYNNLVYYDYAEPVESPDTIRPELAESWSWSADRTALAFKLRQGVKWHDGRPFTAADVKHTFDVVRGAKRGDMKLNPRRVWYGQVREITTSGDHEVTFHLKRPQSSLLSMFACGVSAVYPAHVSFAELRGKPLGTGPFRLTAFLRDQHVIEDKNPDYFVKGRPYLDGIRFIVIKGTSSQVAALIAGQVDAAPPVFTLKPVAEQIKAGNPKIAFAERVTSGTQNVIINTKRSPFNNIRLRQAVNLALDRNAMIKTLYRGGAVPGSAFIPLPWGHWGLDKAQIEALPGFGDPEQNKAEARKILAEEGYGPKNPLKFVISTRAVPAYSEPANWMAGQLKQVGIETTVELSEVGTWFAKVARRDYLIGSNQTAAFIDDPDAQLYENYSCTSIRNYTSYCNPEIEKKFDRQSVESDDAARRKLVQEIDVQLQHEGARPYLLYRYNYYAHWPFVKNWIPHISAYNSWRMQEVWLDR
ncbi:MAG: ABC transporter substrate-binding protein [Candidatus Lambdaproteobacteria bacterium]|nr:ABC transporter substrate-binding protein [Candidatus Lambdaproteobacteria bacterium]